MTLEDFLKENNVKVEKKIIDLVIKYISSLDIKSMNLALRMVNLSGDSKSIDSILSLLSKIIEKGDDFALSDSTDIIFDMDEKYKSFITLYFYCGGITDTAVKDLYKSLSLPGIEDISLFNSSEPKRLSSIKVPEKDEESVDKVISILQGELPYIIGSNKLTTELETGEKIIYLSK